MRSVDNLGNMHPIEFPEKNFTFQKPKSMTDEECSSLDVYSGHYADGAPCIFSRWEFNKEELDAIKVGELTGVWLGIIGEGMPPVIVQTESPFI